ncbi:hypothetical protein EAH68_14080 [Corynebacterium hylobatis]|uniref:Serine hydrolase n=1 Tax=Corynebacterium hylobatis TaxID=1859290 RepID=A0A3S0BFQ0_9CORY|nr:hypothetical protein [Corynebacterium hylobatis]RSZ61273.1 hypothetical protein EAH68_14080 [Corynebacterium hylobatis]
MRKRLIAGLLSAALLAGCGSPPQPPPPTVTVWVTPTPTPEPPPPESPEEQGTVREAVDRVIDRYGGEAEVAFFDGEQARTAGLVQDAPAWSTVKIPIAVAALRRDPSLVGAVQTAVRVSDNQAAQQLWLSLGTPEEAGRATEAILAEAGVATAVQAAVTRPEFSSFGQTRWTPQDQVVFAARLPCLADAEPVLAAMGQIAAGQDYGLGIIPGAHYKGGWGPDPDGRYVVRQFGLVPTDGGQGVSPVALIVRPASGQYADGQAMLTALAQQLPDLPAVDCRA